MSTDNSTCANCGKNEDEHDAKFKECTACKSVKYCTRECQRAHWKQHKNECRRIADDLLFKDPPPREECPICMLTLPIDDTQASFKSCCGQLICGGCIVGIPDNQCPYCREPFEEDDSKRFHQVEKLAERGNPHAINNVASCYRYGTNGYPKDLTKVHELLVELGELGYAIGYSRLGQMYDKCLKGNENDVYVSSDIKKAVQYYELAARMGDIAARHNLGMIEEDAGNYERSCKHYLIAAKAGNEISLNAIREGFKYGIVSKDMYTEALRGYQKSQAGMTSDNRETFSKIWSEYGHLC